MRIGSNRSSIEGVDRAARVNHARVEALRSTHGTRRESVLAHVPLDGFDVRARTRNGSRLPVHRPARSCPASASCHRTMSSGVATSFRCAVPPGYA